MRTTVGIIGAGPAGLFAANVLTRAGIDSIVVERLDEIAVREGQPLRHGAITEKSILQLRGAQLARLMDDDVFTRAFARTYVGVDPMDTASGHASISW